MSAGKRCTSWSRWGELRIVLTSCFFLLAYDADAYLHVVYASWLVRLIMPLTRGKLDQNLCGQELHRVSKCDPPRLISKCRRLFAMSSLPQAGLLAEDELNDVIAHEFNPVRCGFHGAPEVWTRDVLNLGVRPDALIQRMRRRLEAAGGEVLERTELGGMQVG